MPLDFNGEQYAKASAHQREWGRKLIDGLTLQGHERILDLGCGDGAVTAELAQRVPRGNVIGIDASSGMLDVARRHISSNLHFELRDINELGYESEFDLVFSNATLHFVRNHERILRNVYRALRAGGVVRFNFAGDGNCSHYFQAVREEMRAPTFKSLFRGFEWPYFMPEIDRYKDLVAKSTFSEYEVWGENADRFFPDTEALTKWIDSPSIVPFLAHLDQAHKQPFRNAVVARTISLTQQADGSYFETFRRVNVLARK